MIENHDKKLQSFWKKMKMVISKISALSELIFTSSKLPRYLELRLSGFLECYKLIAHVEAVGGGVALKLALSMKR